MGFSQGQLYQVYLQFWGIFFFWDLGTHNPLPQLCIHLGFFFASPQYRPLEHIFKRCACIGNWVTLTEQKYLWKQRLCMYVYFVCKYMRLRTALQEKIHQSSINIILRNKYRNLQVKCEIHVLKIWLFVIPHILNKIM